MPKQLIETHGRRACLGIIRRLLGSASGGSAGVCDEASESQDKNPRETDNA